MEVTHDNLAEWQQIKPFDFEALKTVAYAPLSSSIFAPAQGVVQHVYRFHTGHLAELSLRRTIGIPRLGSVHELIWLKAFNSEGDTVFIGVESEYVYDRTGMLITPGIASHSNERTVPVYAVMEAVLYELEGILGFELHQLLSREELPASLTTSHLNDYIALDHKGRCKLLVVSTARCLNQFESEARAYCMDFLERQREWSSKLRTCVSLGLYPVKRQWEPTELALLDDGDLLALKGSPRDESVYLLRGFLQLQRAGIHSFKYEVQYNMSDDDISLEFSGDSIDDYQTPKLEITAPPHEQIELEILIGHTHIPLGELCGVQSGTLIELGQHSLPMVTLRVNGEPILEGELVHFKDQLMVQVTKRLA